MGLMDKIREAAAAGQLGQLKNTYFSLTCYVNHNQENSLKALDFESFYTLF